MGYSLNDKLKYLRKNRDLTQADLGDLLNMTRQGYAHYEKGTRSPDHKSILKLANYYKISANELIDDREVPEEIAYIYESELYSTNKDYNKLVTTIKINANEKNLISLFRQLDSKEQSLLLNQIEQKIEKK